MKSVDYTKIDEFQIDSPIYPIGYYFSIGKSQKEKSKIAVVFRNVSNKNITAIKGTIKTMDSFREKIYPISFKLTRLSGFKNGAQVGYDIFHVVPDNATIFEFIVKTVVFDNDDVFDIQTEKRFNLKKLKKDTNIPNSLLARPSNKNRENLLSIKYSSKFIIHKNDPVFFDESFICSCGTYNYKNSQKCWSCGVKKKALKDIFYGNVNSYVKVIEKALDIFWNGKEKLDLKRYYRSISNAKTPEAYKDLKPIAKQVITKLSNEFNNFSEFDKFQINNLLGLNLQHSLDEYQKIIKHYKKLEQPMREQRIQREKKETELARQKRQKVIEDNKNRISEIIKLSTLKILTMGLLLIFSIIFVILNDFNYGQYILNPFSLIEDDGILAFFSFAVTYFGPFGLIVLAASEIQRNFFILSNDTSPIKKLEKLNQSSMFSKKNSHWIAVSLSFIFVLSMALVILPILFMSGSFFEVLIAFGGFFVILLILMMEWIFLFD